MAVATPRINEVDFCAQMAGEDTSLSANPTIYPFHEALPARQDARNTSDDHRPQDGRGE